MKRKNTGILALTALLAMSLTGCGCKHETWNDADCITPKTCADCGKTEGEALGHTWAEASCTAPKTCTACKETEGEVLDHTWKDATCEAPKTCSVCSITDSTAAGHTTTRGKCSACNDYILDDAFIPDYDDFTNCLGVDSIPIDFIITSVNETSTGFDVYTSIADSKRVEGCEDYGWEVGLGYVGTSDFHILSTLMMNYVPKDQDDLTNLYNALIDEITDRLGEPDAGGTAWTDPTGTLTLEIFKVSNAVTIAITM